MSENPINMQELTEENFEVLRRRIQRREINKMKPISISLNVLSAASFTAAGATGLLALCLMGSEDEEEVSDRRKLLAATGITAGLGGVLMHANHKSAKKYARRMADSSYVAGYQRGLYEAVTNLDTDLLDMEDKLQDVEDRLDEYSRRLAEQNPAVAELQRAGGVQVSGEGRPMTNPMAQVVYTGAETHAQVDPGKVAESSAKKLSDEEVLAGERAAVGPDYMNPEAEQ